MVPVDAQVQHLLDDIAKTADGGTTVEEMQRVINLCNVYYSAQPDACHQVRDRPRGPVPDD